jgi:hypothetical protein
MKTYTKKSSDDAMLKNLKKMAKSDVFFTNLKSFGKSTPTAKVLLALNLISLYKDSCKKYVWIGDYPTEKTVKLIKDYVRQIETENKQKPKSINCFIETLNIDTDDFDKDDCTKKEPDVTTKYEIVKRKTKSCHNTVKFSHWLFSNCNLDINQVTDIIDNISINNNADTILNLVVKYNIPTPNVKLFVSECKNFN